MASISLSRIRAGRVDGNLVKAPKPCLTDRMVSYSVDEYWSAGGHDLIEIGYVLVAQTYTAVAHGLAD